MKFHIISDLHLEFAGYTPSAAAMTADAVILAGDICAGTSAIAWAANAFPGKPVIYVPGNHEYYGYDLAKWHSDAARIQQSFPNVHVCQTDSLLFPNQGGDAPIRVLGTTLWTDFRLYGANRRNYVAERVQRALADYRAISLGSKLLRWQDTLSLHDLYRAWLATEAAAAQSRGEKVIIVTHHAPSLRSSAPIYVDDLVTAGFASDLEAFASQNAHVWVHGHMHNSSAYSIGRCMVICNPRGYPPRMGQVDFENSRFNPDFILEVK